MNDVLEKNKLKMKRKRKFIDNMYNSLTIGSSLIGVIILIAIVIYVLIKGSSLISFDLIFGDYYPTEYHLGVYPTEHCNCDMPSDLEEGSVFSSKWGVSVLETEDSSGASQIVFNYIDVNSPLYDSYDIYDTESDIYIREGLKIHRISFVDGPIIVSIDGVDSIIDAFDNNDEIKELYISGEGGGIRGSLISTLYMIFFTLLFALPLGIFTAIYLNEYAQKGFLTNQLRKLIEMLTGVPSIIFGMVGLVVFIPLTSVIGLDGRNIIAASLTLAVIILPTIIRSTEESLKVIPNDIRQASLALGANNTQTTFRVVLPNALPGILTATLLGIGRVVGESAALIFVMGTVINDYVSINGTSTSLAVQIWSIMSGEIPNFELASAISIVILIVVLVLNLSVKFVSYRLQKVWH